MYSIRSLLPGLLALVPGFFVPGALASEPLDRDFGADGLRVLAQHGGYVDPIGACPNANGSVTVIGYRGATTSLVLARLTDRGALDTTFSTDGLAEIRVSTSFDSRNAATACTGVGNADPADDRVMVAGRAPATNDLLVMALVDTNDGTLDDNFFLGSVGQYDISGLAFPPDGQGTHLYPRTHVRGVFPGPGGSWIVLGQFTNATATQAGFVARVAPAGAVDTVVQPVMSGRTIVETHVARTGLDGDLRVMATARGAGNADVWALLRLNPQTLATVSVPATAPEDGFSFRMYRGRQVSGGSVVAALRGDTSPSGVSPRLLVIREDAVSEVTLPSPSSLDGAGVLFSAGDGALSATGASGGRAIVAAQLRNGQSSQVGFYAAVVKLGDGAGVADAVDAQFGDGGRAQFRYRPQPTVCGAGSVPNQEFGNVSSWGDAVVLVANTERDCGTALERPLLAARILSDARVIFRDSYE